MERSALIRRLLPSPRALRLSLYLTCVFCAASVLASRLLYAQVKDAALEFGHELSGLADLTRGAEIVVVNGHTFHHVTMSVEQPLRAVLDRLEEHCAANAGVLGQVLASAQSGREDTFSKDERVNALRHAVLREQAGDRGVVVCFSDRRASGLEGLRQAILEFSKTSDLSRFGHVVYSYAERIADGETHVVTLWTDRGLDLKRLVPAKGDANGTDSPVVPRPPAARRTLSAAAPGTPFGVRVYESTLTLTVAQRFYADWMKQHQWQLAGKSDAYGTTAYLRQDGYEAIVSLAEIEGHTYVTLSEAGRADGSSIAEIEVGQ
jgi:hypothetical protein